jgi:hypothetical protein
MWVGCGSEPDPAVPGASVVVDGGVADVRDAGQPQPDDTTPDASLDAGTDAAPPPCVPLSGTSEVLAAKLDGPHGITLDATHVYFAESRVSSGRLEALSKSDAGITQLGWGGAAYGIRNDNDAIYWVSYSSLPGAPPERSGVVSRVAKADGATTILAQGTLGEHEDGRWTKLAMDETSLYWLDTGTLLHDYVDGQVMKISKSGASATPLAANQDNLFDIAVSSESLWWMASDGIHRKGKNGGLAAVFVPFATLPNIITGADVLALDDSHLYFTTGAEIRRAAIATGATEQLYARDRVVALTTDAACVYFATKDAIFQMPKAGGAPLPIATVIGDVWTMATDDSGLYYVDYTNGTVHRVAR